MYLCVCHIFIPIYETGRKNEEREKKIVLVFMSTLSFCNMSFDTHSHREREVNLRKALFVPGHFLTLHKRLPD